MQDATETYQKPELIEEPLSLELYFTFPLNHAIELTVLKEQMFSVAVDTFGVVGNIV